MLLLALVAVVIFIWGISLQSRVKKLQSQLRPIASVELYAKTAQRTADSTLAKAREEAEQIISDATSDANRITEQGELDLDAAREEAATITDDARKESSQLRNRIDTLRAEAKTAKNELELLNEGLRLKADDAHLLEVGYYEPVYGFEDLPRYQQAIEKIKEAQKAMLRIAGETQDKPAAAYATTTISYNNSDTEGKKLLKKVLQLMLRAFNGECDAFIARVNYRNVTTMQKRIQSSFDQINKIASIWGCQLNENYLTNRLQELNLVYEYAELQEKIKEEQAWLREQEREEEKARRDAEKAIRDADRRQREASEREAVIAKAVEEMRRTIETASNNQKAQYQKQLEALEQQLADTSRDLADALEQGKRAQSLAQQTRAGYVYILSNIGSFGDSVYKIGMTRREDPEERRMELGDASVPFPFDKHAYIWTEDAPTLERALHQHFSEQRLNLANNRKEFFKISIEEIQAEIERIKEKLGIRAAIRWTQLAEAKDFRLSEAKRKHLEGGEVDT